MPKINLDTVLKTVDGKDYTDKTQLSTVLLYALGQTNAKNTDDQAMVCYSLRKRIFEGGEIELTKSEIELLKTQVNYTEKLTKENFFSVVDILEG